MTYVHPWYTQQSLLESTTNLELKSKPKQKTETTGLKYTNGVVPRTEVPERPERMFKECRYCGAETRKPSWNSSRQKFHHHKDCTTCKDFKSLHGFTLTPEDRAFLDKKPYCGICGTTENLAVDHCHETNKIRGYLCRPHNSAIGFLGDNIEGVMRAVNYLSTHV